MFKFGEYTVRFKHVRPNAPGDMEKDYFGVSVSKSLIRDMVKEGTLLPYKAKTSCTITQEGSTEVVSWGVAMLSWFDPFDQQFALEKSFKRAIENLYPKSTPGYKVLRRTAWIEFARHHKTNMGDLTEATKVEML